MTDFEEAKRKLNEEWGKLWEIEANKHIEKNNHIQELNDENHNLKSELLNVRKNEVRDSALSFAVSLRVSHTHLNNFYHLIDYERVINSELTLENYQLLKNTLYLAIIIIASKMVIEAPNQDYLIRVKEAWNKLNNGITSQDNPLYVKEMEEREQLKIKLNNIK